MATLNITNIPAPRVPFIDERTGLMAREWYRFFLNLFVLTGSGGNPVTLEELQLGPPSQQDFTEIIAQVAGNLGPQYEDQSGDFLATLDTAQLMSMMARFENLESAIQGAYLDPPSVPTDGVYVPYNNATTNVDLNNKHIVNVAHIGVGTSSTPDTLILAVGDNGSLSRVVMRGYSANASSSSMRVSKYRGTVTAPQVPQSGDSLGRYEFAGYTTTSADGSAGAYWEGVTTETWGATANGTKVLLKVTPNTTTTPVTAVTVDQDKSVTFATTASATTFIGALTGTASGNLVSGGALGTPSSGTVTNLTGTASININGTVGATTATTGAFTTVSANALAAINLSNATYSQILSASNMYIDTTANNINIRPSGVAAGIFSSTGLAVTGAMSATGIVSGTQGSFSAGNGAINLSNATYSQIISASTMYIDTTANLINIRPFGTLAAAFSSTGVAITGTVNTSGYTVATLPTGVTGARAYVTNALAPTFGSAVVGGGAVTIPVFYNGANWIVG